MKYCAQCGAELEDNARFCTSCGRSVEGDINEVNSDVNLSEKEVEADVSIAKTASAKSTDIDDGSNDKAAAEEDLVDASVQADKAIEVGKGAAEKPKAVAATGITHAEAETDGSAEPAVAETTESAQSANFKAAMDSSKRKSKRKIPMVVLVAIITMLTAGVAFAAYYVYTEVIVPQQEQAAQEAAEQEQRVEATDINGETVEISQATGNPQNFLQIAEILAMNPEDIPGYLDEQGLIRHDYIEGETSFDDFPYLTTASKFWDVAGGDSEDFTVWTLEGKWEALEGLDTENSWMSNIKTYSGRSEKESSSYFSFSIGSSIAETAEGFYEPSEAAYKSAEQLESGEPVDSVAVILPFSLEEESCQAFFDTCGLGKPLAAVDCSDQTRKYHNSDVYSGTTAFAGSTSISEFPSFWYYVSVNSFGQSSLGCVSSDVAKSLVLVTQIYTEEEWAAASLEGQSLMLAQAIEESYVTGQDGSRLNVVTDEFEFALLDSEGNDHWLTADEYEDAGGKISSDGRYILESADVM